MGCGAQLDHLRSEEYLPLVPIVSAMIERNLNSYPPSSGPRLDPGAPSIDTLGTLPAGRRVEAGV
jgi:hypothetical protein